MTLSIPRERVRRLQRSLNCDGYYGAALLIVCALILLLESGGETARMALRYDRHGLEAGQWWRLLSAHVVHLGLEHALLNIAGLVLMWALFARDYDPLGWTVILLAAAGAIDAGLWLRDSTVAWYVGSSGVLHGVLAAGSLAHILRREREGWVLAGFLLLKLLYEQTHGALPLTEGGAVVVDAHLYGAAGGLAAALLLQGLYALARARRLGRAGNLPRARKPL